MNLEAPEALAVRPTESGLDLDGRTGLVLGATGGLGRAIVAELLGHGARLFVHGATNRSALADLTSHPQVEGALADLARPDEVAELFAAVADWCGNKLGFLVYCAGVNPSAAELPEISVEDWDSTLAVNLRGAYLSTSHAAPMLRQGDPGKIVLVSSIFGVEAPANRGAYSASKHGLEALAQTLSKEEGSVLHINALCPGPVWGENVMRIFVEHARERGISVEEYTKIRTRSIPALRFLEPQEFARTVALFCSRVTDYINGEVIKITGGACQ
jgi:NAD(P)-dependent dehydrogenase (short-subunit alcohol dehydrogenase family)